MDVQITKQVDRLDKDKFANYLRKDPITRSINRNIDKQKAQTAKQASDLQGMRDASRINQPLAPWPTKRQVPLKPKLLKDRSQHLVEMPGYKPDPIHPEITEHGGKASTEKIPTITHKVRQLDDIQNSIGDEFNGFTKGLNEWLSRSKAFISGKKPLPSMEVTHGPGSQYAKEMDAALKHKNEAIQKGGPSSGRKLFKPTEDFFEQPVNIAKTVPSMTGEQLGKLHGVRYDGVQEGLGMQFTDPGSGSTTYGNNSDELKSNLFKLRERFAKPPTPAVNRVVEHPPIQGG
jgi:hypothetical protein